MADNQQINVRRIARHLLFWLAYFLYQMVREGWQNNDQLIFELQPQFFTSIPVTILFTYTNLYLLMPLFFYKKKYVQYLALMVLLLFANGISQRYFTWLIWNPWDKVHHPALYLA